MLLGYLSYSLIVEWASQVVLVVKNLWDNAGRCKETWVRSLGWEGPLEEATATHSSILAWRIPWTEEPGGLQPIGWQSRARLERQHAHTHRWGMGVLLCVKSTVRA